MYDSWMFHRLLKPWCKGFSIDVLHEHKAPTQRMYIAWKTWWNAGQFSNGWRCLLQTDAMIIDVRLAAVLCILQLVQLRKVCNNTFARYVCDVWEYVGSSKAWPVMCYPVQITPQERIWLHCHKWRRGGLRPAMKLLFKLQLLQLQFLQLKQSWF